MSTKKVRCLTGLAIVLGFASCAFAQGGGPARFYNPSTETTLKGSVVKVSTYTGGMGRSGIHLTVKGEDGTYDVHVGPSAYVTGKGFTFAEKDEIEVVGSKVQFNGVDALIAREIRKDGKVLTLRNSRGIPLWSRGGWAAQ